MRLRHPRPGRSSHHDRNRTLNGIVTLQSGQPYNPIDCSGAIASVYNSTTVNISDPILGFTPGMPLSQIALQGTTGYNVNNLLIDTSKIYVPTAAPGTFGVPACATVNCSQVCDTYETTFADSHATVSALRSRVGPIFRSLRPRS